MQKIKIGDLVQSLKKVKMTVRSVKGDKITCDWFDDKNQLHRVKFNRDKLSIIN